MLNIILFGLSCWFLSGFIIYSIKVFVFCRGTKHYMDLNMFVLQTAKSPIANQLQDQRNKMGDRPFIVGAFIIATILGPLIIIDFIRFAILVNRCMKINEKTVG